MKKQISKIKVDDFIATMQFTSCQETSFLEKTNHILIPDDMEPGSTKMYRFFECLTDPPEMDIYYENGETDKLDCIYRTEDLALRVGWNKNGETFAKFYVINNLGQMEEITL